VEEFEPSPRPQPHPTCLFRTLSPRTPRKTFLIRMTSSKPPSPFFPSSQVNESRPRHPAILSSFAAPMLTGLFRSPGSPSGFPIFVLCRSLGLLLHFGFLKYQPFFPTFSGKFVLIMKTPLLPDVLSSSFPKHIFTETSVYLAFSPSFFASTFFFLRTSLNPGPPWRVPPRSSRV